MSLRWVTLGEVSVPRGLQTGPFGSQLHAHEYVPGGIPVVMPKNLVDGQIMHDGISSVSEERAQMLHKHRFRIGDLVFARRGDIGRLALVTADEEGWICGTGCLRVRLGEGVIPEFAALVLQSPDTQKWLKRNARGQTMLNLNTAILTDVPLILLPIVGQVAIVRATSALDNLRAQLDKLITAKRRFLMGLKHQLLNGQRRFPEFKNSPWIDVHLGEIFVERSEINRPDLPLLSVTNDRGVIPRDDLNKRDTSNPDKSKYQRVAVGDIAYNTMRMWQGVSALSTLEGIVSPAYTVAIPTDNIDGRFAKHLFKYPPVIHRFFRYSQGLVDDTLNLKFDRFSKIHARIPKSGAEQRRIAEVLDTCDREIGLLEQLQEQVGLQKRALLMRLVSGSIAIPEETS